MKNRISFKFEGERVTSDKFRRGVGSFYSLLDEITNEISGKKKAVNWLVSVKQGSIELIAEGEPVNIEEDVVINVINKLDKGLESLEETTYRPNYRPEYFTDNALELVENLAVLPDRTDELNKISIRVNGKHHNITPHSIANIHSILGTRGKAIGSVEGKLLTLSKRAGITVIVYDSLSDKPVRCVISDDLIPIAVEAFEKDKRVSVIGMISYGKEGIPQSIKVEEIKVFPDKEELPSAFDVYGILGA